MDTHSTIYVAGGRTLIGSALHRVLDQRRFEGVLDAAAEPQLTDSAALDGVFERYRPDYVFFAVGRSGGIQANTRYPAELMHDNLLSATNVLHAAHVHGVKKLLYLASSCSYPRAAVQPMQPSSLMTGPLEPTNEAYAMAKLAGLTLCQAYRQQYGDFFIRAIPADAFGAGDDFSLDDSHVVAALVLKMHQARIDHTPSVEVWGTGTPRREFIFVDDLADACLFAMENYAGMDPINLGGGADRSIAELASEIKRVVGYTGELHFDTSKPDGMPMKRLESSPLLEMGWRPQTSLSDGLAATYKEFRARQPIGVAHV